MPSLFPINLLDIVPTPLFAKIVMTAAATQQQQVAAVAGQKIRVLAYTITVQGATNLSFRSASTDISGVMAFAAAGEKLSAPFSPTGHFETVAGEALNINQSGAVIDGGHLVYVLV
jgi:hypothetical protein